MENKSVTFLSSRGTGLNVDLKLVERELTKTLSKENISYRFFLKNERSENPMAGQGYARAKKEFCDSMTNAVCTDASLSSNLRNLAEEGVRVLLAAPYDYQFKNMIAMRERKGEPRQWKTFRNFTHIIPGSPFASELFRNSYALEDIQIVDKPCMPLVWEINQPERQEQMEKKFQFYFPGMKGKKVLSVILYGEERKRSQWFREFDVRALLEQLGPDWFILVNHPDLMERAYTLNSHYRDSFGYVNRILPAQDLLYVSDLLVTNNGRFASYFVSREKPVYCPDFRGNYFEQYMRECYPDMFLNRFSGMLEKMTDGGESGDYRKFYDHMVYKELCSPYDEICRILGYGCRD